MSGRTIAHKFLTVSTFLSVLAAMGCGYSPVSPSQDDTSPGVENPVFVQITIDMPRYPEAMVELGPHGIEFNKNITMTMPLAKLDSDATSYRTLWNDENAGIWVDVGGRVENDNIVTKLEHFSGYGFDPHQ